MGGVVGFDYAVLPVLLQAYEVPPGQWAAILVKLRAICEIAVRYCNRDTAKDK